MAHRGPKLTLILDASRLQNFQFQASRRDVNISFEICIIPFVPLFLRQIPQTQWDCFVKELWSKWSLIVLWHFCKCRCIYICGREWEFISEYLSLLPRASFYQCRWVVMVIRYFNSFAAKWYRLHHRGLRWLRNKYICDGVTTDIQCTATKFKALLQLFLDIKCTQDDVSRAWTNFEGSDRRRNLLLVGTRWSHRFFTNLNTWMIGNGSPFRKYFNLCLTIDIIVGLNPNSYRVPLIPLIAPLIANGYWQYIYCTWKVIVSSLEILFFSPES